jgi:hypothetical protein
MVASWTSGAARAHHSTPEARLASTCAALAYDTVGTRNCQSADQSTWRVAREAPQGASGPRNYSKWHLRGGAAKCALRAAKVAKDALHLNGVRIALVTNGRVPVVLDVASTSRASKNIVAMVANRTSGAERAHHSTHETAWQVPAPHSPLTPLTPPALAAIGSQLASCPWGFARCKWTSKLHQKAPPRGKCKRRISGCQSCERCPAPARPVVPLVTHGRVPAVPGVRLQLRGNQEQRGKGRQLYLRSRKGAS